MQNFFFGLIISTPFLVPSVVFAAPTNLTIATLLKSVVSFIYGSVIPVVGGALVLLFFYGIFRYLLASGNTEKHEEGRKFMLYGLLGLVVVYSLWAIIAILQVTFFGGSVRGNGAVIDETAGFGPYGDGTSGRSIYFKEVRPEDEAFTF